MLSVSTNTVRHALHKASVGSLEKQKQMLLTAKNVHCMLEFAQCHQDWTIHDWYRVVFWLRTMDFRLIVALGVGWGMENLNYKLFMWVKQLNMEVVQCLCEVTVWLPVTWVTCARERGWWYNLCVLAFFKVIRWGHEENWMVLFQPFSCHISAW